MGSKHQKYPCPKCKKLLDWNSARRGRTARCRFCRQSHTVPTALPQKSPAAAPAKPSHDIPRHLVAEHIDELTRWRVLERLVNSFSCGIRDPEMLYLGARYAASLGQRGLAFRFLQPLKELLRGEDEPLPAFFPVGLLCAYVLPEGDEREAILSDLRTLSAKSPRLAHAFRVAGCDPQGPLPAGSPHRLLQWARQDLDGGLIRGEDGKAELEANGEVRLGSVWRLSRIASAAYSAGDTAVARRVLERLLVLDGDYPAALHNLITVASEQRDVEAYLRYWRRYVKVLLWRIMRGDQAADAYDELMQFYARVAEITNREFSDAGQKAVEKLQTPGLLPRWLEAYGALVWLETARQPYRDQQTALAAAEQQAAGLGRLAVMRFWYRAFYPEFLPHLETGSFPKTDGFPHRRRAATRLLFDPSDILLTRFAEWSRLQFGLTSDSDEHAMVIAALSGLVARLPLGVVARQDNGQAGHGASGAEPSNGDTYEPCVNRLNQILRKNELDPPPFRRLLQDACSVALRFSLNRFLKKDESDWAGLIEFYGDPDSLDRLAPDLRLFVALGYCIEGKTRKGLEVACRTLPDLQPDDLKEDAQCRSLWKNVVQAGIKEAADSDSSQHKKAFAKLRQRVETALQGDDKEEMRKECLEEIDQVATSIVVREQVDQTIEKSKKLVEEKKFSEAKRLVRKLPTEPKDLQELKKSLLDQITEAEEASKLHDQIDAAIAKSKKLVKKKKFREAKQAIRELPDRPNDVKKVKKSLLEQIEQAEQMDGINERIESAIERSKNLVGKGKFADAKREIRKLPDTPADLKEVKANILSQIADVEKQATAAKAENVKIMARLMSKGVDLAKVLQIAKDNNVDMSNQLQWNGFLKAVEEQVDSH